MCWARGGKVYWGTEGKVYWGSGGGVTGGSGGGVCSSEDYTCGDESLQRIERLDVERECLDGAELPASRSNLQKLRAAGYLGRNNG